MSLNITVRKSTSRDVSLDLKSDGKGGAVLTANGEAILRVTSRGYLSRLRDVSERAGIRRLPDGRIAIRPKRR